MNGYSRITEDQCRRYGIQSGAYEAACKAIMSRAIKTLKEKFYGARLKLIHGASDMGVDKAIQEAADDNKIIPLGFSCPRYMLYVKDDNIPVYIAANKDDYSNKYIQSLDLLITTGGREQVLHHDILASIIYNKHIHIVDVLNSLSATGGVPATVMEADGRIRVDNAAAAMGRNLTFFSREDAIKYASPGNDRWDIILDNIASIASDVCRQKISPNIKFSHVNR